MKLLVKIRREPTGAYQASCPALPGCVVWGCSRRQAHEKLHQAVCGYLANLDVTLPRELARLAEVS